jgi:hypothetical protein
MAERYGGRSIWWFYVAAAVYCLIEATAVLLGLRVIPYFRSSIAFVVLPSWLIGTMIEYWLTTFAGDQPSSDREFLRWNSRVMSKGSVYLLPPLFAITGSVLGWTTWLSVALFLGLMLRVGWLFSRRGPVSAQHAET